MIAKIVAKIKMLSKREYFIIFLEVLFGCFVWLLLNFLLVWVTSDAEFSLNFQKGALFFKGEQVSMGIKETILFVLVFFLAFSWETYRKKRKKANEMQE
ncbi:MAG: hypothetical protein KGV44_07660 [Flavobacteriaceae bacterium]|nr:hypothetical protein [Flavobacteriaceae bacterium]